MLPIFEDLVEGFVLARLIESLTCLLTHQQQSIVYCVEIAILHSLAKTASAPDT